MSRIHHGGRFLAIALSSAVFGAAAYGHCTVAWTIAVTPTDLLVDDEPTALPVVIDGMPFPGPEGATAVVWRGDICEALELRHSVDGTFVTLWSDCLR